MGEGLFTSSDNGANWTKTSTSGSTGIAVAPNGDFVSGGSGGAVRSVNNGQTWTSLSGGGNITSIFVTSAGTVLAGTFNSGVNRLPSGGTWANSGSSPFGSVSIGRFVQLTNGTIYSHTLGGIFRSTDDGASWTVVAGTPVGVQYRILVSTGGVLLLGTPSGLYKSTNEGGVWTTHSDGLLNTILDRLAIAPDGRLYGAGGAGIYRTTSPIITAVGQTTSDLPDEFKLEQNYPNPFNPSTRIRFSVPASVGAGHVVSLRVYDLLGREVTTLVNEVMQPGSHEVTWDAGGLASGVYFYRFQEGEFTQTKRLILLR
ncbi:MAG: T9SS type A sorting domain-containing protein [Bacteroidetes bacterium]|nr:T9SS type A sorting domain-containing protein [Bacteroidota bacterium]MCW5894410.1 T9SS type A sorting domain-containing protein [Bacteroidota bacterium]